MLSKAINTHIINIIKNPHTRLLLMYGRKKKDVDNGVVGGWKVGGVVSKGVSTSAPYVTISSPKRSYTPVLYGLFRFKKLMELQ